MNSDEEDVIDAILEQTAPSNLEEHFIESIANSEANKDVFSDSEKVTKTIDSTGKKILEEAEILVTPW